MSRYEAALSALLAAAFAFYVLFDQFGLLAWARAALGLGLFDLAPALACLVLAGGLAALATSRLIAAAQPNALARLRLVAVAHLLEGALGLWCLGAASANDLAWRLVLLGAAQGGHIVLILGLFNSATRPAVLGRCAAAAAGLSYLLANLAAAWLIRDPAALCMASAIFSLLVGVLASLALEQGQLERIELRPLRNVMSPRRVLPALLSVVVLDSALWQVLTALGGAAALGPQSGAGAWALNGLLHLLAAGLGGLLWPLLGPRRLCGLAGLSLALCAGLLIWRGQDASALGVMILQSMAVGLYSVALFATWSGLGERMLGPGLALVGFVGSPLGVGLGLLLSAAPQFGLGLLAAAGACLAAAALRGRVRSSAIGS